ncbi:hypothetical protein AAHB62_01015 [Bacillus cereus]
MAHGQAGAISYVFKGENGTFKSKITYDKHIIDEREDCHEVAVFKNR